MNKVQLLFIVLLIGKVGFEFVLDLLNGRHARAASESVPEGIKSFADPDAYRKSVRYTLAKTRFNLFNNLWDGGVLALVLFSGLLPWLYERLTGLLGATLWAQAFLLFLLGIILSLPSLPLDWWNQFHLEERFGFNKSTLKLWISDKFKGLFIGFLLGYPLLCLILWMIDLPAWWLWAFGAVFLFQLLMMIIYPRFIMPLFNKFEPLPEGGLRDRLLRLAERTGFKTRSILVMDGSRRSGHSNAFFTGFGKFRRIILYDTLIEQLSGEELEAVLAHEIGHYRLGHIPKHLALSAFSILAGFWLLAWLAERNWFYEAFGFARGEGMAPALLLFSLLSGLVTFWLSPCLNRWSRKHEYEADAFAREAMKNPKPLIDSLWALHEKNLGNLTPHPFYSAFYYSHPTILEREAALKRAPAG